jgi:hypothetical protein
MRAILTPRVEDDRVEEVTARLGHDGQDAGKVGDPVTDRNDRWRHDGHAEDDNPRDDPDIPEPLPHGRPFLEEVRQLDFLDSRGPLHVVPGQMGESEGFVSRLFLDIRLAWREYLQRSGEMPRQAAEEEEEEHDPLQKSAEMDRTKRYMGRAHFEVVNQGISEWICVQPVLEDGRGDVWETGENDDTGQEDLPRFEVVQIKGVGEQADQDPVEQWQCQRTSDGVVGWDVRQDRDLRMQGDTVGPDKSLVKRRDGSFLEPLAQRLEQQFGTSVSVLLPSIEL